MKNVKMQYNRFNAIYSRMNNPANPKIRQILIQTKNAAILNSILGLI